MIEKNIMVDGQQVPFRASAAIPRLYRAKFNRDIFKDVLCLTIALKNKEKGNKEDDEAGLQISDLEMFENIAYIMAKHADPSQPDTPEEWLDQFSTFSIYIILPQILELWRANTKTDVEPKKKRGRAAGK